jgi:hypothetical protein
MSFFFFLKSIAIEEQRYFINSDAFWGNVLPFLDAQTLKKLSTLNHVLHNAIITEKFVPYYRSTLEILITYVPRNSNFANYPLQEKLFRLNMANGTHNVIELEKILNLGTECNKDGVIKPRRQRILFRLHVQLVQSTPRREDHYFIPLDGAIIITERAYVNMHSLRRKLSCLFQEFPVAVVNKDSGTSFTQEKRWSSNTIMQVLEGKLFNHNLDQIEEQVFTFFAYNSGLNKLALRLRQYQHNISRLLDMGKYEFFWLADQLCVIYVLPFRTDPLEPCNGFLRAISFHEFETHIQKRILEKWYRHYVGYKPHLPNVVRLTDTAENEIKKIGQPLFDRLNGIIERQTGQKYKPVSVQYIPNRNCFIVRYWQAVLNSDVINCRLIAIKIPLSNNSHANVYTEMVSREINYTRRILSSIEEFLTYYFNEE